jgi:hypothetical protein
MSCAHSSSGNPPTERGQGDRLAAELVGQLEAAARRARDQAGVGAQVPPHDGAVDHPAGREPAGSGGEGLAEWDGAQSDRFALDLLATRSLDGTGDSSAHPEMVVRGVRDGVDREGGDVALDDLECERRRYGSLFRSSATGAPPARGRIRASA